MDSFAKIVITKNEGRRIGYVIDRVFDFSNFILIGYYVADDETEGEYFLSCESVIQESDELVIIEDVVVLQFVSEKRASIIGKMVVDELANNYGVVKNIILKKNKIEKIITNKCEICKKNIKKIGFDVIFIGFYKKNKEKRKIKIFDNKDEFLDIPVPVQIQKHSVVPEKVNLSTECYLGKVVLKDVFGYNNERIVSKGSVVSKNIFMKAKKHNKLNELFFAIKSEN